MRAGTMDRRIRLERVVGKPRSASGQPSPEWALDAEVWAEVLQNRGQEVFSSNQFAAKAELRFRIRYPATFGTLPNPGEDYRVVYEGRSYDILQVAELGRREGLDIFASARAEVAA